MAFKNIQIAFGYDVLREFPSDAHVIQLSSGEVTIVSGPNGVGKSALIDEIFRGVGIRGDRLSGFRQIHFSSAETDDVGQSVENLRRSMVSDTTTFTRYSNPWADQHLKSFMRRLKDAELQALQDIYAAQKSGESFNASAEKNKPLLERINQCFEAAKLTVRLDITGGRIVSRRGNEVYSIDRMSDGERAALLLISAILVQPQFGCMLIDEPERHLNPAISAPLIASATRLRPDLAYVFASHDLALIEALRPNNILHIRDSRIVSSIPETRQYDVHFIPEADGIPIDLKVGLLGSRKALLLTEGTDTSEDRALYSLVYPGWHILPRGGNQTVATDVPAINVHGGYAWIKVAGLVDGDGRSQPEKDALLEKAVHCLPCPTIENLFFLPEIVAAMAEAIHALVGGLAVGERVAKANREAIDEITKSRDEILYRRTTWNANRKLSEAKTSVDEVRKGQDVIHGIDIKALKEGLAHELDEHIRKNDGPTLITSVPIKNSKVPARVATSRGYAGFPEYKQAVLKQIESGSAYGAVILDALRDALPKIGDPG